MSTARRNTLREVMKLAWKMFREHGGEFSLALKWAWMAVKSEMWKESIITGHKLLCTTETKPERRNTYGTYTGFRGIGLGY